MWRCCRGCLCSRRSLGTPCTWFYRRRSRRWVGRSCHPVLLLRGFCRSRKCIRFSTVRRGRWGLSRRHRQRRSRWRRHKLMATFFLMNEEEYVLTAGLFPCFRFVSALKILDKKITVTAQILGEIETIMHFFSVLVSEWIINASLAELSLVHNLRRRNTSVGLYRAFWTFPRHLT